MAIEINGAGTIDGIAVGGLNDGIITDAELNLSANASNIKTALNASGDSPVYACRAWVNWDGITGSGNTIRASGNVSSVTRNGTGDYTVNFATAMPSSNYSMTGSMGRAPGTGVRMTGLAGANPSTTSATIRVEASSGAVTDVEYACLAFFN